MSTALATIHPGHAIVVSPAVDDECSFVSGDHGADRLAAEYRTNQCRQPATRTAVGMNGLAANLCRDHAAHAQACQTCSPDVLLVCELMPRRPAEWAEALQAAFDAAMRRIRWALFVAHLRVRRELRCGCHRHRTYGPVVTGGCPHHD